MQPAEQLLYTSASPVLASPPQASATTNFTQFPCVLHTSRSLKKPFLLLLTPYLIPLCLTFSCSVGTGLDVTFWPPTPRLGPNLLMFIHSIHNPLCVFTQRHQQEVHCISVKKMTIIITDVHWLKGIKNMSTIRTPPTKAHNKHFLPTSIYEHITTVYEMCMIIKTQANICLKRKQIWKIESKLSFSKHV